MEPIYTSRNAAPAYQLNWALAVFWRDAPLPDRDWLQPVTKAVEADGVRILRHKPVANASHFLLSTKPHVSPEKILWSVKGRLHHHLRDRGTKLLKKNYDIHSTGASDRSAVIGYVADQLGHHQMAEPAVMERLSDYQRNYPSDLAQYRSTAHGRFRNNLHLVFVMQERWNYIEARFLDQIAEMVERSAAKHGHLLSNLGLLPDHVHLAIGVGADESPEEAALSYLNNCAYAMGMKPIFEFGYYAGTFGEFDRGVF